MEGNRSLVTIANLTRDKIEYLIEMAAEFEKHPNRRLLEGKVVATLFSSRLHGRACRLRRLQTAWEHG